MDTTSVMMGDTEHERLRDAAQADWLLWAERLGVSSPAMARIEAEGSLERIAPGVYLGAQHPRLALSEAAAWSIRHPAVVAGLLTAAIHHRLTGAFAGGTWLLSPKGASVPRSRTFPLQILQVAPWLIDPSCDEDNGIETVTVHGTPVRVTGCSRTVLDLWRYPRRVSAEHALHALRRLVARPDFDLPSFSRLARRVGPWPRIEPVLQGMLLR